jgi:acyl-CoA synthetase (AMP-forming)/AMP-acid ligase II
VVILYGEASVEWYLAQYGCMLAGLVVVPVLDGSSAAQLAAIACRCSPAMLIVSPKCLAAATEAVEIYLRSKSGAASAPGVVTIGNPSDPPYELSEHSPSPFANAAAVPVQPGGAPTSALTIGAVAALGRQTLLSTVSNGGGGGFGGSDGGDGGSTCRTSRTPSPRSWRSWLLGSDHIRLPEAPSPPQRLPPTTEAMPLGPANTPLQLEGSDPTDQSTVMLMPTSGSSGAPKLIIVTTAMCLRQFTAPRFGVRVVM